MMAYAQSTYATRRAAGLGTDRFLRVSLGSWNPTGCLVSVIDDSAHAAIAAAALRAAGFLDEHIRVIPATELLACMEDARRGKGLLARTAYSLADWSDNAAFTAEYLEEARRGHHVVVVYAPSVAQARLAHAAIERYGVHLARHYGPWIVRGLDV